MAANFEPNECIIFVKSTKIGTHKNKAIHSFKGKLLGHCGQACRHTAGITWKGKLSIG